MKAVLHSFAFWLAAFLLSCTFSIASCAAQASAGPNSFDAYAGIYKSKSNDRKLAETAQALTKKAARVPR